MFSGLVRDLGVIEAIEEVNGNRRFTVRGKIAAQDLTLGASVSHSGVCLTVVSAETGDDVSSWVVEAVPETLRLTTLGTKVAGDRVNLEPSLRLGDELGGHLVFGHVDGLGEITEICEEGDGYRVTFFAPEELRPMIALKGSISIDGISLTVAGITEDGFQVALIPHTWSVTSLGLSKVGDKVNLEADMLARYVSRQMEFR
ncbi:riboflavin synthase [Ponticaulis sp.]|uniref:riboflavin synthase n=1 Tax=Ponticaulis sp. TaxID=2020902 RepID=UPI000B67867F|nr:riboflavin synthase [Ponticaulis sp.]MAI92060.1 riboflavin synthase [Ponticaulis sp.]OUX96237.1 MAG: riboflavin synthase [Hyphomonadaceae bacterium TMED5]|tara:strand:+ start:27421 stop:28023 length:603 start_codon:yes stop_codon:yes gene_type:complete